MYYIIYKEFEDGSWGAGYWNVCYITFRDSGKAKQWIEDVRSNPNISDVIGPLSNAKAWLKEVKNAPNVYPVRAYPLKTVKRKR